MPDSTDCRTSSCRKAYAGASNRSMPDVTHSSTASAVTSGIACTSVGSTREPMTAADSSARRACGESRCTRARTASWTVGGRWLPPDATTSVTKNAFPPVSR